MNTRPDPARWREIIFNYMLFEPVIDGEILSTLPIKAVAAGASWDVDVLVGTNSEEWRFFTVPNSAIDMIDDNILAFAITAYGLSPTEALAVYREALPGASAGDLQAAVVTDWFFRIPAIRLAEAHAAGRGATYVYEMTWRSPQFGGRLGSCHALEIPFVFDNLDRRKTGRWWARTLHSSLPIPCTKLGFPSRRTAILAGHATIRLSARQCASTRSRRW